MPLLSCILNNLRDPTTDTSTAIISLVAEDPSVVLGVRTKTPDVAVMSFVMDNPVLLYPRSAEIKIVANSPLFTAKNNVPPNINRIRNSRRKSIYRHSISK